MNIVNNYFLWLASFSRCLWSTLLVVFVFKNYYCVEKTNLSWCYFSNEDMCLLDLGESIKIQDLN